MQDDANPINVGNDAVQRRAYELYEQRDREDGHDWDDWLAAEHELRGSAGADVAEVPTEVAPANARRRHAEQSQPGSRDQSRAGVISGKRRRRQRRLAIWCASARGRNRFHVDSRLQFNCSTGV
jgi:Protein of unknown function (DUF2934)